MLLREIENLDRMADWLDSRFRIPGTTVNFGFDALLGLIPGLGDIVTFGPTAYICYRGHQMGARRRTLVRMAGNAVIDWAIGSVPLIGDIFDVAFKANKRNVALLREDLIGAHAPGSPAVATAR